MQNRFSHEQLVLSERLPATLLELEEFVELPAYIGTESTKHTHYDGQILSISFHNPVLAERGNVVIEILGPYWDRVFVLAFSEVSKVTTSGFCYSQGIDLKSITIEPGPDNSKLCTLHSLSFDHQLSLLFSSATVKCQMLVKPLDRVVGI